MPCEQVVSTESASPTSTHLGESLIERGEPGCENSVVDKVFPESRGSEIGGRLKVARVVRGIRIDVDVVVRERSEDGTTESLLLPRGLPALSPLDSVVGFEEEEEGVEGDKEGEVFV